MGEVSDHIRSPTRIPSDSFRSDFALATSCNQTQCSAAEAISLEVHFFRRRTAHCLFFDCQDCAAVEHQAGARPRATQAGAAMQFRRKIYQRMRPSHETERGRDWDCRYHTDIQRHCLGAPWPDRFCPTLDCRPAADPHVTRKKGSIAVL